MSENKKYYWLKLKENFFEEKHIKYLRTLPDGDKLVIVYQKMQLKSLRTEGFIQYDKILPSNVEELAMILDEDTNAVKLAIGALVKSGAVEILDDGSFYMLAMQDLIGKEGASAERVRQFRDRQKHLALPKQEAKTNAERQRSFRAKKVCEEKQHIPMIEDYQNQKRYGGNYYIVMKRDQFKCKICNSIEALCVHHIDGYDENKPENNSENKMVVLCRYCHSNIHAGHKISEDILESISYYDDDGNDSNEFCNTDVTKCNTEIEIEKEIEKDNIKSGDKPPQKKPNYSKQYKEIIDYLNNKLGTQYKYKSVQTQKLIKSRLEEGFTITDFKTVIDKKYTEWYKDEKMRQYLRPVTLFGTKFEGYLNQDIQIEEEKKEQKTIIEFDTELGQFVEKIVYGE